MRRLLIAALVLAVVIAGGSFALWRWAEGRMQMQLEAWTTTQQAQGWKIAYGAPAQTGWPLAAALVLPKVSITSPAAPVPVTWTAEQVTVQVAALSLGQVSVQASGTQTVQAGADAPVQYTAAQLILSAPLEIPLRSAALNISGLHIAGGADIGLLQAQIGHRTDGAGLAVHAAAEAIDFPPAPAPQPPLGSHVASASADAILTGDAPASGLPPAAAASAWAASGGQLDIKHIALGWGPLGVSGTGTVTLDGALQPAFELKLHLIGYEAALQALAASHSITLNASRATAAVLALMAKTPEGGGAPTVDVPLALHDRTLSMGHIRLTKLPELVWPNAALPATVGP